MTKFIEVQDQLLRPDRKPVRVPVRDDEDSVVFTDASETEMKMETATTVSFLRHFMLAMPPVICKKGEDAHRANAIWNDIFNAEDMVKRLKERTKAAVKQGKNGSGDSPELSDEVVGDPELAASLRAKLNPDMAYMIMRDSDYRWVRRQMDAAIPVKKDDKESGVTENTYLESLLSPHHLSAHAISTQLMDIDDRKAEDEEPEDKD